MKDMTTMSGKWLSTLYLAIIALYIVYIMSMAFINTFCDCL